MKNTRQKGLSFCREVHKILEGIGHQVDGPFYGVAFYDNSMRPIHRDIFGIYDLISFYEGKLIGHQVSTEANKSTKIKEIQKTNFPCWIWSRFHNEDQGTGFEVTIIIGGGIIIEEKEMIYGLWRRPKVTKIERDGLS